MMWSFYDAATGRFTGRRFSGPESSLKDNTPAGVVAIEGEYDALSQRVDVMTGAVVPYERPAAEIEAEQRSFRDRRARKRIDDLERQQARRVRELLAPSDTRLQVIDDEIALLRADLSKPAA